MLNSWLPNSNYRKGLCLGIIHCDPILLFQSICIAFLMFSFENSLFLRPFQCAHSLLWHMFNHCFALPFPNEYYYLQNLIIFAFEIVIVLGISQKTWPDGPRHPVLSQEAPSFPTCLRQVTRGLTAGLGAVTEILCVVGAGMSPFWCWRCWPLERIKRGCSLVTELQGASLLPESIISIAWGRKKQFPAAPGLNRQKSPRAQSSCPPCVFSEPPEVLWGVSEYPDTDQRWWGRSEYGS